MCEMDFILFLVYQEKYRFHLSDICPSVCLDVKAFLLNVYFI